MSTLITTTVQGVQNIKYDSSTTAMTIDSAGRVLQPAIPRFEAGFSNDDVVNVGTTNGSDYRITFTQEIADVGSCWDGAHTFTAPVTGKYQFNVSLSVSQIDTAATQYLIRINTSNRNYHLAIDPEFGSDTLFPFSISALADMDASDTAIVTISQDGGTAQTDVRADPGSHFSGYLVC